MPTRQELESLLAATPDDVFLQYATALACLSEGDSGEGVRRLEEICRTSPDYVAAWLQLGQLLMRSGEPDAAQKVLTEGIQVAIRVGNAHAESEMRGFLDML